MTCVIIWPARPLPASRRACCKLSHAASKSSCGQRMQSISLGQAMSSSSFFSPDSSLLMGMVQAGACVASVKLSLDGKISRSISTPHASQAACSSLL